jgi:NADPH-dependent 7-cyano-7-deazaguanine reductase QueF
MEKIKLPIDALKNIEEIKYEKIAPFDNVCPVTRAVEKCNIELIYKPRNHVVEIGSFRDRMARGFDCHIEVIAGTVHAEIYRLINPRRLEVVVYMIDGRLTPWSVRTYYESD